MKTTIDLSVLKISHHAAERYCQRVLKLPVSYATCGRAMRRLAALLKSARPLPLQPTHDGVSEHAWGLQDCVAIEKRGCVTTILTNDMYGKKAGGDAS